MRLEKEISLRDSSIPLRLGYHRSITCPVHSQNDFCAKDHRAPKPRTSFQETLPENGITFKPHHSALISQTSILFPHLQLRLSINGLPEPRSITHHHLTRPRHHKCHRHSLAQEDLTLHPSLCPSPTRRRIAHIQIPRFPSEQQARCRRDGLIASQLGALAYVVEESDESEY